MRMMGLDVGDKRIGVALCDPMEILASTLTVIERERDNSEFETILKLVKQHDVERVIIGLPRLMDGGLGTQSEKTLAFVEELSSLTRVPIETYDERCSSDEAEQKLRAAGKNHQQIKEMRDAAAAALILQWYIDERHIGIEKYMENENV